MFPACRSRWRTLRYLAATAGLASPTRKLVMLDAAASIDFLRSPPGNRLEALKGDREGQYSIRVNDQFRLRRRWTHEGPENVEIVDCR